MTERAYRQLRNSNPDGFICKIWWEYNPDANSIEEKYFLHTECISLYSFPFNESGCFLINNKNQITFTCSVDENNVVKEFYSAYVTKDKVNEFAQILLKKEHKNLFNQQKEIAKEFKKNQKKMKELNCMLMNFKNS